MEIIFDNVKTTKLDNVSFTINKPGIYSFIGSSNSGISDIGLLLTKNEVNSGKVKCSTQNIGYVLNNPYDMFKHKTIYDELYSYMQRYKNKSDSRIEEALKLVNLDSDYLGKLPSDLNINESRKLSLACTLISNPKVIILDSITSGLISKDKKELIRLLKILKNKYNRIIILITKDTDFCYEVSDYVYLFNEGKIIESGKKEILETFDLNSINLEVPNIISFVKSCRKQGHDISYYTNIMDLIKAVYRDVY